MNIASELVEVLILLKLALARQHLENHVKFGALQQEKHIDKLAVEATKMVREWEHITYKDRLRAPGLFILNKRRLDDS